MKAKRLLVLGVIFLLAGCSTNLQNKQTKQSIPTTHKVESEKKVSATKGTETTAQETSTTESGKPTSSGTTVSQIKQQELWDTNKSSQLASFVIQWGNTLGQEYKNYTPQNNVSLYGTPLPQAVINGNWKMAINESPVTVQWSEDGKRKCRF